MQKTDITRGSLGGYSSVKYEFNSIPEFVSFILKEIGSQKEASESLSGGQEDWYDNETCKVSCTKALIGDQSLVAESEEFLNKMHYETELELPMWRNDVVGYIPDVPSFLSGNPECMRIRGPEVSDRAPINVYVSLCVSGGVSVQTLKNRGLAVLALIRELSQVRPVKLFFFSEGASFGGRGLTLQLIDASDSLHSISVAAYCLTSAGFYRNTLLGIDMIKQDSGGQWAYQTYGKDLWNCNSKYRKHIAGLIGAGENDLIIPPVFMYDPDVKLLKNNPSDWVQRELNRFMHKENRLETV